MAISLVKGQKVDLTKSNPGLTQIMVGLGWDPANAGSNFDADGSIICLKANDKLEDTVYFGKTKSKDGSIQHSGDNLTGAGDGDDEQIMIDLSKVSPEIEKLVAIVNIYDAHDRGQHFGMVQNAFIRLVNQSNGQELIRYDLTGDYSGKTAMVIGELYRHNGEWKFAATGEGTNEGSINEMQRRYR